MGTAVSELRFSFDETQREVSDFYQFAKDHLSPSAEACMIAFRSRLSQIRARAPLTNNPPAVLNRAYGWEIPDHQPLLTKPSQAYERGLRNAGPEVVGRLTALWQVIPDPRISKYDTPKQFRLSGIASVRVEWIDTVTHQTLSMWRMEIGDTGSPGCMFHVQILGSSELPPFPRSISVPRLPCLAFTPTAVAEFMLGELFQDVWEKHSATTSREMQDWREAQKRRLSTLLAWQQDVVSFAEIPPWIALKRARMPENRLVVPK